MQQWVITQVTNNLLTLPSTQVRGLNRKPPQQQERECLIGGPFGGHRFGGD